MTAVATEAEEVDLARVSLRECKRPPAHACAGPGSASLAHPASGRRSTPSRPGLDAEVEVDIDGHVGYYCAGMNKRATVRIHGMCGVGVAENMMSGTVVVEGNASAGRGSERPRRPARGPR